VPLKAYNGVNNTSATTLYASDRDVFVFLVDEARPIELDGQTYFRGFYTWGTVKLRGLEFVSRSDRDVVDRQCPMSFHQATGCTPTTSHQMR
jgi:hypothetical protein